MKRLILFLGLICLFTSAEAKKRKVKIVTSKGTIVVLLSDKTPKHRDNFLKLSKEGFYNGTLFHRVIKEFMIQGGDPQGNGSGGPGAATPHGAGGADTPRPAKRFFKKSRRGPRPPDKV